MTHKKDSTHTSEEEKAEDKKEHKKEENVKEKTAEQPQKERKHAKHLPIVIIALSVLLLISPIFLIVKAPYQVTESYTDIQPQEVSATRTVEDLSKPIRTQVCEEDNSKIKIEDHNVYGKPYGLTGYKCYASFKVINNDNAAVKKTYRYVFIINGGEYPTAEKVYTIPKLNAITYKFEFDGCKDGDSITGRYELVGEKEQVCRTVTTYENKTETVTETKLVETTKTRPITKYRPLWQAIFGVEGN
ncbi:MAG: hypothetical protein V1859_05915 [archaeon]